MRRLFRRSPLSDDPREFVLAAVLFTVAAVLFAGFGVETLSGGGFDAGDLRGAGLAYRVLQWGKYAAFARLLWIAHGSSVRHQVLGWRRAALLWTPLALFALYGWLQWGVLGPARAAYVAGSGRPDVLAPNPEFAAGPILAAALAATALNAAWVRHRSLRIAR